jgi:hypothetical protein
MDAITSFVSLTDTVPSWIQQAKDLSAHSSKKHAEYVAEYTRRLNRIRSKKERTLSLASIHTHHTEPVEASPSPPPPPPPPEILERPTESTPEPPTPNPLHTLPLEAGNTYLLTQSQRKRKLGASVRSGASGPQRFRSKRKAVIYYDAYLQEQLDSLVKGIGGARNNLRKGKLSRSASRGFQLPCFDRASHQGNHGIPSWNGLKNPPTSYLSVPTDSKVQPANRQPTADEAFAIADKHLEGAQSLCETAAHQVLRDGDCSVELNTVVTKLESALEVATATVAQLREEEAEQKEQAENQSQTDTEAMPLTDTSSPPSLSNSSISKLVPSLSEKMEFSSLALAVGSGGVTEIEVDDDSDQESIIVDISKFRAARTRSHGLRT